MLIRRLAHRHAALMKATAIEAALPSLCRPRPFAGVRADGRVRLRALRRSAYLCEDAPTRAHHAVTGMATVESVRRMRAAGDSCSTATRPCLIRIRPPPSSGAALRQRMLCCYASDGWRRRARRSTRRSATFVAHAAPRLAQAECKPPLPGPRGPACRGASAGVCVCARAPGLDHRPHLPYDSRVRSPSPFRLRDDNGELRPRDRGGAPPPSPATRTSGCGAAVPSRPKRSLAPPVRAEALLRLPAGILEDPGPVQAYSERIRPHAIPENGYGKCLRARWSSTFWACCGSRR